MQFNYKKYFATLKAILILGTTVSSVPISEWDRGTHSIPLSTDILQVPPRPEISNLVEILPRSSETGSGSNPVHKINMDHTFVSKFDIRFDKLLESVFSSPNVNNADFAGYTAEQRSSNLCSMKQFGEDYTGVIINAELSKKSKFKIIFTRCVNGTDVEDEVSYTSDISENAKMPWSQPLCLGGRLNEKAQTCYVVARRPALFYMPFDVHAPKTWVGGLFTCINPDECQNEDSTPMWPLFSSEFLTYIDREETAFRFPLFITQNEKIMMDTPLLDGQVNWDKRYAPQNWEDYIDIQENYVHVQKTFSRFLLDMSFKLTRKFLHLIHLLTRIPTVSAFDEKRILAGVIERDVVELSEVDISMRETDESVDFVDFDEETIYTYETPKDNDIYRAAMEFSGSPLSIDHIAEAGLKAPSSLFNQFLNTLYTFDDKFYNQIKKSDKPKYKHAPKPENPSKFLDERK